MSNTTNARMCPLLVLRPDLDALCDRAGCSWWIATIGDEGQCAILAIGIAAYLHEEAK